MQNCSLDVPLDAHRNSSFAKTPRKRLLVKHLSKAGGTFVIALAQSVVPQQMFTVRVEGQPVSPADFRRHFVIGMVREPCSSYVSMWAFGSSGKGEFLLGMRRHLGSWRRVWELYGARPPYNSSSDVARFRAWMRLPEVRGLVTTRFLASYSAQPWVDCWVMADVIRPTLTACLRQYAAQGGVVNWTQVTSNSTWAQASRAHAHSSEHAACAIYYDDLLAAEVESGFDRALYSTFAWPRCCASTTPSNQTSSISPPTHAPSSARPLHPEASKVTGHFIHIPKAAGETIEQLVHTQPPGPFGKTQRLIFGRNVTAGMAARRDALGLCGTSPTSNDWYHLPPRHWNAWPAEWIPNSFCVVRYPIARALSAYMHHCSRARQPAAMNSSDAAGAWLTREIDKFTSARQSCHFVPQSNFVWDAAGRRTCQHVLCHEALPAAFDALSVQLGWELPSLTSVRRITHHAPSNLTADALPLAARDAVLKRYEADLCFLGYEPCATEALRAERSRLERPVTCKSLQASTHQHTAAGRK